MAQLLTHIVQKSFGDDTINELDPLQQRQAGECVNAMFWRTTPALERDRHLTIMPESLDPIPDSFGRFWIDMDMLLKSKRTPLATEVDDAPIIVNQARDDMDWLLGFDPEAEDIDFNALVEYGFTLPVRVSEGYKLWNGAIVVASLGEAGEEHSAGVRTRLRELRAEHLAPAAGSVTEN